MSGTDHVNEIKRLETELGGARTELAQKNAQIAIARELLHAAYQRVPEECEWWDTTAWMNRVESLLAASRPAPTPAAAHADYAERKRRIEQGTHPANKRSASTEEGVVRTFNTVSTVPGARNPFVKCTE